MDKESREDVRASVVMGFGTGLGIVQLFHFADSDEFCVRPTEAGHMGFAPNNNEEFEYM